MSQQRIVHTLLYLSLFSVSLLIIALATGVLYKDKYLHVTKPFSIHVSEEDTVFSVTSQLREKGAIPYDWVFLTTFLLQTKNQDLVAKDVYIHPNDTYDMLIHRLQTNDE